MKFEWNEVKRRTNKKKHGIDFAAAAEVFLDPDRFIIYDEVHSADEDRWRVIGRCRSSDMLFVVYTELDEETARIISARRATPNEEAAYYTR